MNNNCNMCQSGQAYCCINPPPPHFSSLTQYKCVSYSDETDGGVPFSQSETQGFPSYGSTFFQSPSDLSLQLVVGRELILLSIGAGYSSDLEESPLRPLHFMDQNLMTQPNPCMRGFQIQSRCDSQVKKRRTQILANASSVYHIKTKKKKKRENPVYCLI